MIISLAYFAEKIGRTLLLTSPLTQMSDLTSSATDEFSMFSHFIEKKNAIAATHYVTRSTPCSPSLQPKKTGQGAASALFGHQGSKFMIYNSYNSRRVTGFKVKAMNSIQAQIRLLNSLSLFCLTRWFFF